MNPNPQTTPVSQHAANVSPEFAYPDDSEQRRVWLLQLGALDVDWHLASLNKRQDLADDYAVQIQQLEQKLRFQ